MAGKSDSEFSKSRNFRELDDALKRSFGSIKQDMLEVREGFHQQVVRLAELRRDVKDAKADMVTLDKVNILKIKLGELNENMKKIWELEKKLEGLDKKALAVSEFDKYAVATDNEIKKLREDVKDLDSSRTTDAQTKQVVSDINAEFDKVKKGIDELRSIKDTITKEEVEKRSAELNKKAQKVRDDFEKLREKVRTKVDASQVEALVSDINGEFDNLKSRIAEMVKGEERFVLNDVFEKEIERVSQKISTISREAASAVDVFSKGVETSFKDMSKQSEKKYSALSRDNKTIGERLSKRIDELKSSISEQASETKDAVKALLTRKQAENLVNDLNKEFDVVKADIESNSKEVVQLRKEFATKKQLESDMDSVRQGLSQLSKDISLLMKESATKKDIGDCEQMVGLNSRDIAAVEKDLKKEIKSLVSEDDLHDELDVIHDEFVKLHSEFNSLGNKMLEQDDLDEFVSVLKRHMSDSKENFATRKQFDKLSREVERLQDALSYQGAVISQKDRELKAYSREMKASKKGKGFFASRKEEKNSKPADTVPFRKTSFLSKFLIAAAFIVLIVAIVFFFSGLTAVTDMLAVAGVVCFILGIILRVVVGLKSDE